MTNPEKAPEKQRLKLGMVTEMVTPQRFGAYMYEEQFVLIRLKHPEPMRAKTRRQELGNQQKCCVNSVL
jgi:hypothetical protein